MTSSLLPAGSLAPSIDATPLPTAAFGLLAALLVAAGLAWYWARHRRTRYRAGLPGSASPVVLATSRLNAHTQLCVLRWGKLDLLVAVSAHAAPVVLERRPLADEGHAP